MLVLLNSIFHFETEGLLQPDEYEWHKIINHLLESNNILKLKKVIVVCIKTTDSFSITSSEQVE